ncbi:MAG: hypothetical protein NT018_00025 [Armatimonadetes bacterium]|nr:hypothetical protein [Armatimonadota bacterium]
MAEPVKEIIIVFKQHYDLGFWGTCQEGFLRPVTAKKMIDTFRTFHLDQALDACEKTKDNPPGERFVWTVPGWVMAQMAAKDQDPVRRKRLVEAVRRGQISWLANPYTSQTDSMDLEEVVRGLGFGSQLSREFGLPLPQAANMTDVPEHTWAVSTILKNAGVKFFHIGCNPCSSWPDVPPLYWWEGPDGSRTLSMYTPANYGTGMKPPAGWPHKTWLWLDIRGDNCGAQSANDVQEMLDRAKREMPGVRVRIGALSDFAEAILAEKPDLPVIRKDMPDTWIFGIMSMPQETGIVRNLRPRVGALESLDTLLNAWQVKTQPAAPIVAAAYEKSLMFDEHTWGSWVGYDAKDYLYGKEWEKARAEGRYKEIEATYKEHGDYARAAQAVVEPAIEERMKSLAHAVKADGKRIVVFNPLPWKRNDIVDLAVSPDFPRGTITLRDVSANRDIPAECDGKTMRFQAVDLPPLGYRTFALPKTQAPRLPASGELKADSAAGVLENRFLRVKLDKTRGVITSIIDKTTGRELVDTHAKYGFGQYLYERFSDDNIKAYLAKYGTFDPWVICKSHLPPASQVPYAAASPKGFTLTAKTDAVSASIAMSSAPGEGTPHAISLRVTLYHDQPVVDLEWAIQDKKPDSWPEAGWLCLPVNAAEPQFRLARLGGIVNPATDIVKKANIDLFSLNGGMTVCGQDGKGVGICPADSPLVSLGYPGLLQYNSEWTPREPVVFVNLFNNIWGCNYQQWVEGSWRSRVRVWSVQGDKNEANLITPSWEARSRCLAFIADGPAGTLPPEQSGVEISRKGVLVTAFGDDPDGNTGTLLRIWDHSGIAGEISIKLPIGCKFTKALPVTLRGEPKGAAIPVKNNELRCELGAYAPCSFILTR